MTDQQLKPLQILNASAGSGKTYNLVLTYLKLILGPGRSPQTFSQIMAMTFTNKAALEMKTRIISALDLLSNPERTSSKETQKAKQYTLDVAQALDCEPDDLQKRAQLALKQILHQYEEFHVMTIDKFNLRLIRSFSKDLDLPADFQIILNEDEVLDQVIDQILDGLDAKTQQKLTNLVLRYSKEKLEDQEGWNFQRDLKSFATILTNEKYFPLLEALMQADFSEGRYSELNLQLKTIKDDLTAAAQAVHTAFSALDPQSVPGKSTTVKTFANLVSPQLLKIEREGGHFFTTTVLTNLEKGAFPPDVTQLSLAFDRQYQDGISNYNLLSLFRKNFFNMALLQFISQELDGVKQNEQLIRISEFNKLISALIKHEEAPFIYERLGNRFQHFLLDEFQDTSRLQWMNIIPLIHESLSQNKENLIVGDPKQSIYRFKNGLAEQFVALPAIYNPEQDENIARKSEYFEFLGNKQPLNDNWRSAREIVEFNNDFFAALRNQIPEELAAFYADVNQNPQGKTGGYVSVHSEKLAEKEENSGEKAVSLLLSWIESCVADGIEKGDICILGNTKKDCNRWAIELTSKGYKVVSADSLLVNSDHFVKLTIAYLKWRQHPAGELEARRFSELYFSAHSDNSIATIRSYWQTDTNAEGRTFSYFDSPRFFKEQFESEEAFFFPYQNLYNLVQGFYSLAKLEEIHNPYLHHLADMAHDFDLQRGPELELFLSEYDRKGKDSAIQIPENKEAIKIMTGHKSKGLEFPVVMLPHMDWSIGSKKAAFLLQEQGEFIYTTLSKKSNLASVRALYESEGNQSLLDKINLCYVMFTRAVERLYIGNYCQAKPRDQRFGTYLHSVLETLPHAQTAENNIIQFQIGQPQIHLPHLDADADESQNFVPVSLQNKLWFPDISLQEKGLDDAPGLSEQQRYGNQLHLLLSLIREENQIASTVSSLITGGQIEAAFENNLLTDLQRIFSLQAYQDLLKNATAVLREQAILISPTEHKRPDQIILKAAETIVLDYKTGMPEAKHIKQVQQYVKTLRIMDYPDVKGFVFYTGELRLVEVG